MPITTTNVTINGAELAATMDAISWATRETRMDLMILGCLAMAIVTSDPNISVPRLAEGVKELSTQLSMWIAAGTNEPMVAN